MDSWSLLAVTMKARTAVVIGRGEKSMLSDPGSNLRLGREKRNKKHEDIVEGMSNK